MRRTGEGCALVLYGAKAAKRTCAVSALGSALDGPLKSLQRWACPMEPRLCCTGCAAVGRRGSTRKAPGTRHAKLATGLQWGSFVLCSWWAVWLAARRRQSQAPALLQYMCCHVIPACVRGQVQRSLPSAAFSLSCCVQYAVAPGLHAFSSAPGASISGALVQR